MIENIKAKAHNVSEGFLKFGKDINSEILGMYEGGDIENKEVLKRVCELANQNIYLSLFNDSNTDKSSISFDYADYNRILKESGSMKDEMTAYDFSPEDFRDGLLSLGKVASQSSTTQRDNSEQMKVACKDSISNMINNLEKVAESFTKLAEEAYSELKSNVKSLSYNGETIDDMSKIACDYSNMYNFNTEKVASAFSLASKELVSTGFKINNGLTKVASQDIDTDSEFFSPVEKLAVSIDAISASKEIIARLKNAI